MFNFQLASAVRRIPSGQGGVVALRNIVAAFGLLGGKLYIVVVSLPVRKVLVIGPHLPRGFMAKGSGILSVSSNSYITFSPLMM